MEFCNGGSLSQYLQARGGWLCEAEARFLVIQISKGMAAISRQNIVHRDLKLDNILIQFPYYHQNKSQKADNYFIQNFNFKQQSLTCKIADLGFAKELASG